MTTPGEEVRVGKSKNPKGEEWKITATVSANAERRITTKGRAVGLILSKALERKLREKTILNHVADMLKIQNKMAGMVQTFQ